MAITELIEACLEHSKEQQKPIDIKNILEDYEILIDEYVTNMDYDSRTNSVPTLRLLNEAKIYAQTQIGYRLCNGGYTNSENK